MEKTMRAIWSGSINFGLVNIPIKLYSGSEDTGLDLTMLHKADLSPIRYARICRADGKEVSYHDIVKGYEYQKGDYIVLTDKDFENARSDSSHSIEIVEFVAEKEIDIRFFEKPYYLEPQKNAEPAYALLREALNKAKKVAVAKFVLRNREDIAIIKPVGEVLVLNKIRYISEIRQPNGLKLPDIKSTHNKQIDIALALIEQLTKHFDPEDFHDTYAETLEEVIAEKIKGKKPVKKTKAPEVTKVKNLMDALKASLEKTKAARKKAA